MLHGFSPLLIRTFLQDARTAAVHGFRGALLIAIYGSLVTTLLDRSGYSAPGRELFGFLQFLNMVFITSAGIFLLTQTITEEKEEETLGLMRLAGVGSTAVVLGKLSSRLMMMAWLILVQIPMIALCITLGGVTWTQVFAVYTALVAYLFLVSGVGLLASTLCATGVLAIRAASIFAGVYFLPPIFVEVIGGPIKQFIDAVYRRLSISYRLEDVGDSTFNGSVWSLSETFSVLVGAACIAASCLLLDRYAFTGPRQSVTRWSRLWKRSVGRVWDASIVWKDFTHLGGGYRAVLLRCLGYALLWLFALWAEGFDDDVFSLVLSFGLLALWIETSMTATRIFHDEQKQQTWAILMLLPTSLRHVAIGKIFGAYSALWPGIGTVFAAAAGGIASSMTSSNMPDEALSVMMLGVLLYFLVCVSYLVLTTLLSLWMGWGAVPASIAATVFMVTLLMGTLQFFMMGTTGVGGIVSMLMVIDAILTCLILVYLVLLDRRLQRITEQG